MTDLESLDPSDLVALIAALAEQTGDNSGLTPDLVLDPLTARADGGGWTPAQAARGRALAADLLARFRALGRVAPDLAEDGDAVLRRATLEWVVGQPLDDSMAAMLTEEMGLGPDLRAPTWHTSSDGGGRPSRVAVIGAGMSGVLAAHRLLQAGVDVTVFEKNDSVGGTWFENAYPGCRVDVPNHVYAYSNAQKIDWPFFHSTRDALLGYFRDCANEWDVVDVCRFGCEVIATRWDDQTNEWVVTLAGSDAPERFNAVVSAVGQLNRPVLPDIEGRDRFAGISFHTARWPAELDLTGKRVGVIGTGASAMQAIPEVAKTAESLTVFQRTAAWLIPRPRYHAPLDGALLELLKEIPSFVNWFRARLFWAIHHGSLDAATLDPAWSGSTEQAVSEANDLTRELLTQYLRQEFADRPDLFDSQLPDYPVGAKRFVLDNGVWADTLKRSNVELVTTPIDRISSTGVVADGQAHEFDVLIYATGFDASRFLAPMQVVGRDGADLRDNWGDDARAYFGMTVPGFPNFFCVYGPNTNIVVNGSIIFFSECAARYIVEAIGQLRADGLAAMDLKPQVHQAQVDRVDEANARRSWGVSKVNSWYKSASGKVAQNWPFPLLDYWMGTRRPDPTDYERW